MLLIRRNLSIFHAIAFGVSVWNCTCCSPKCSTFHVRNEGLPQIVRYVIFHQHHVTSRSMMGLIDNSLEMSPSNKPGISVSPFHCILYKIYFKSDFCADTRMEKPKLVLVVHFEKKKSHSTRYSLPNDDGTPRVDLIATNCTTHIFEVPQELKKQLWNVSKITRTPWRGT